MITIDEILERLTEFMEQIKGHKFSFALLLQIIKAVVEVIEELYSDLGTTTGDEKKKLAENAVEYIYRKLNVDIPGLPNWLEIWLVRGMTGILIDWLVKLYNEKGVFNHAAEQEKAA
jgi:hypothetical protein